MRLQKALFAHNLAMDDQRSGGEVNQKNPVREDQKLAQRKRTMVRAAREFGMAWSAYLLRLIKTRPARHNTTPATFTHETFSLKAASPSGISSKVTDVLTTIWSRLILQPAR